MTGTHHYAQAGLTLVELMISLSISLLLVLGVGTFYLANKSSYNVEEQLSRLQESGRFSNYYLAREIRNAGFQGCAGSDDVSINNLISSPSPAYANTYATQGYDGVSSGTFSPTLSAAITGNPVADSDVLTIHTVSNQAYNLSASMTNLTDPIPVNNANIIPGQPVIIANCGAADLFLASAGTQANSIVHSAGDNTSASLSVAYESGSTVVPYFFYAYYIRDTGRVNTLNEPIYALVRENGSNQIEELAEGVEKMKVSYVIDTDAVSGPNQVNQTATAINNANNWNKVVGIQINLLLTTNENVSKAPQPYYFNGSTLTPTDRKLRRQWNIFVSLRNPGGL